MAISISRLPLAGKIGVGAVLTGLLGVAYYVLLHTDVSAQIEHENDQTSKLTAELTKQKQAQQSYLSDKDELSRRRQKQRELNKILPTETEAATFLSAIQGVSNISGVDLKAWRPLGEVNQTYYAKVPMQLELTGRYHQIAKFIYEIAKQDRIINVENLTLSGAKKDGEDVIMSASCLATTFHQLGKKPAAPAKGKKK